MIIKHCFDVRNLILATTLLISLGFVTHATAEQHSVPTDAGEASAAVRAEAQS